MNSLLALIRSGFRRIPQDAQQADPLNVEKYDDLTPNMRALRLAMALADQLLSMGVSASDVTHIALGITDTYCSRKVHIDISYSIITISQDRGIDREPLTIVRTIPQRYMNYQMIQSYQELANAIRDGDIGLDEAENRYDEIDSNPQRYPAWVTYLAGGGLSAGVCILFTGSPTAIAVSFVTGTIISLLVARLFRMGLPTFFVQAMTAFVATLIAVGLTWMVSSGYLGDTLYLNPTLVLIGGIVLLVAGMMIVGALQDAIDEYYVTAGARIMRVIMMTGGIVLGVSGGLYISKRLGIDFISSPERLTLTNITYQYIGAAIIAATFALSNHSRFLGVLLSGATGMVGYFFVLVALQFDVGLIGSYGFAAAVVGFLATLISRVWHVPSISTISAGIVPLVPGLSLYNGLILVVQNEPGTDAFDGGAGTLLRALLMAVSIAAGASFGNIIGRPTRRRLIRLRNRLPKRRIKAE